LQLEFSKICYLSGAWAPWDHYAQAHEEKRSFAAGVAAL